MPAGKLRGKDWEFGIEMYPLLHLKWKPTRSYYMHRELCSMSFDSLDGPVQVGLGQSRMTLMEGRGKKNSLAVQ